MRREQEKFSPTSPSLGEIPRTTVEDYGDDRNRYMNPSDLAQYNLGQIQQVQAHRGRRGSLESATVGATIGVPREDDKVHRPFDVIERISPPSSRGFGRIPLQRKGLMCHIEQGYWCYRVQ